jgi:hypothetical protein
MKLIISNQDAFSQNKKDWNFQAYQRSNIFSDAFSLSTDFFSDLVVNVFHTGLWREKQFLQF